MLLARYGGGLSMRRVNNILSTPMSVILRLMGSALAAQGGKREPERPEIDPDLLALLDRKAKERGLTQ